MVLPGAGIERATAIYYAYLFSVIFAVAVGLMTGSNQRLPVYRFRAWWLYPVIAIGVFLLVFNSNLKVAQADIYYKFGLSSERTGEIDKAIALYHHAIKLAPHWDQYYASLGLACGLKAATASDVNQRVALFEESSTALEHAKQMSPLDPDIMAALGHVCWNWGVLTPDPGQRVEKWEAAVAHYQRAVTLSPSVKAYREANEMAPDSYEGHKGLTSAYLQLGRLDEALEEAKTARDLAPEEEKLALDDLIAQLEAQRK